MASGTAGLLARTTTPAAPCTGRVLGSEPALSGGGSVGTVE
jgi:hypothetical protein